MRFFKSAAEFRKWLAKHHATEPELLVGLYKTGSSRGGLTYPAALDEALCYGWIDGLRRGLDGERWCIRFTPRKKNSIWSAVNLRHVARLTREGRMAAPGLEAFQKRNRARTGLYSFEQRARELSSAWKREFRAERAAWAFFAAQPPSYRRTAAFWVMSAKKEETQRRRLATLIASSAAGRRAPPFAY